MDSPPSKERAYRDALVRIRDICRRNPRDFVTAATASGQAYDIANMTLDANGDLFSTAPEPPDECKHCDELLGERDRAQDALQDTHIALGGDGEWVGRSPPQPAPDSGDLHLDVPELARERMGELERLRAAQPPATEPCTVCRRPLPPLSQWSMPACPTCTEAVETAAGSLPPASEPPVLRDALERIRDGSYPAALNAAQFADRTLLNNPSQPPSVKPWDGRRIFIIPVNLQHCPEAVTEQLLRDKGIVFWIDDPTSTKEPDLPPGFRDIDDVVADHERDPVKKAALDAARRRLGKGEG